MKIQKVHTIIKNNLPSLQTEIDRVSLDFISDGWIIKQISISAVAETDHQYGKALAVFLLEKYKKKVNAKQR